MAAAKGNKNAKGNKGGGRKTDYNKTYAKTAYKLALLGLTDKQMADVFEVSETTINAWKKRHIEFSLALKKGKDIADAEIVTKLYKKASGYKYDEISYEKIVLDTGNSENIKQEVYKKKVVTKEVTPDVTAQIFWLKNRQKDKWKDRQHNTLDIDFNALSDEDLDKIVDKVLNSNKA